ncbi:MAG: hypothetical protein Q7J78_02415 [Clostridiales bacterium]|nr:hypothetical protein [Clostridiales bacterium]
MIIYDFIGIYNETFKYIENKYGANAVMDLWSTISEQYCTHLRDIIGEKGIKGMKEY